MLGFELVSHHLAQVRTSPGTVFYAQQEAEYIEFWVEKIGLFLYNLVCSSWFLFFIRREQNRMKRDRLE